MISERTKSRISILLHLALNNNVILSLQRRNPRTAHMLKLALRCIFLSYAYYYLFVLKDYSFGSFLGFTAFGIGIAQCLGFFPDLLDVSFYIDHKKDFLKKTTLLEFLDLMRHSRSFLSAPQEHPTESNFIASLTPKQQLTLLKLGSSFEDLSLLKTENQHVEKTGLHQHSLQWMAMKSFVETGKSFCVQFPPWLQNVHDVAKTYIKSDNAIINEAQKLMMAQEEDNEQEFNMCQIARHIR